MLYKLSNRVIFIIVSNKKLCGQTKLPKQRDASLAKDTKKPKPASWSNILQLTPRQRTNGHRHHQHLLPHRRQEYTFPTQANETTRPKKGTPYRVVVATTDWQKKDRETEARPTKRYMKVTTRQKKKAHKSHNDRLTGKRKTGRRKANMPSIENSTHARRPT